MEKLKQKYVESIIAVHPELLIIDRYTPPDKTTGGIVIPTAEQDLHAKGARWGKILKISDKQSFKDEVNERKKSLHVGLYVSFEPTSPVMGGHPTFTRIQRVGILDIMDAMEEADFLESVEKSYYSAMTSPSIAVPTSIVIPRR